VFYQDIPLLKNAFLKPLPGREAQLKMAPYYRRQQLEEGHIPADARIGCTLLLLYPDKQLETRFVLMCRNEYAGAHSGQVSFPGGKPAPGEPPAQAARRETFEETGVSPDSLVMLGELSPLYIPPSNFLVYPFVAYAEETPAFSPDPREVRQLLHVPVAGLLNEAVKADTVIMQQAGKELKAPAYYLEGFPVWGATAMMLSEFEEIWRRR
jgi:8-oxo-dGTP pyrophosphatase MutT (NUDIX family)